MPSKIQFRKVLPIVQTAVAVSFGGCGLWLRNVELSAPFFNSTLWNSTASFHVWPSSYRFAAILNLPAILAALLLSAPIGLVRPHVSEWVFYLPSLLTVPFLWYFLGSWLDRSLFRGSHTKHSSASRWVILLVFALACVLISLIPYNPYRDLPLNFDELGPLLWILLGIGIAAFSLYRRFAARRSFSLRS